MKLRELTEAQKQKYMSDITGITKNYDEMISKINGLLLQYGDIHYKMTVDMISREVHKGYCTSYSNYGSFGAFLYREGIEGYEGFRGPGLLQGKLS